MKQLATSVLLIFGLFTLAGCPTAQKPAAKIEVKSKANNSRRIGLELLQRATDPARYREGLQLLNGDIQQDPDARARLALDADGRKFLQATLELTEEELREVESPTYRPADAYYLAECFLLRDAAQSLEIRGLTSEELADRAFRWVCRQVLLHEEGDDGLPPAYVVQRGYGSARDRALVLLALLRQLQLGGCLFIQPESTEQVVLVGVLNKESTEVYLFDPRLGRPVATAAGTVASLKDVQGNPRLLAPSSLTAEQLAGARLAFPLEAMAPRMRELERALTAQDRIVLYRDPAKLQKDVERATSLPVRVWKAPTDGLRRFLPAEDGGTDTGRRLQHFGADRIPWTSIRLALEQIKLGPGQLPDPAFAQLLGFSGALIEKYDLQPHDMLLHGKSAAAVQRLDRARFFLQDENLRDLAQDAEFQKAIGEWRGQVVAAYGALIANGAAAQGQVNVLWADDLYLMTLLQVDAEDPPERYKKKTLTRIAAHAVRDLLMSRVLWLRAMVWQEKAERDQVLALHAMSSNKSAATNAHNAWANTRVAWNEYLDRTDITPATCNARLEIIRAVAKHGGEPGAIQAAHLLETLHLDLHRHIAARLYQAEAAYRLSGAKLAVPLLRAVDDELTGWLDSKTEQTGFKADIDELQRRLRGPSAVSAVRSLELMSRDWAPRGNLDWTRENTRQLIAQWQKP